MVTRGFTLLMLLPEEVKKILLLIDIYRSNHLAGYACLKCNALQLVLMSLGGRMHITVMPHFSLCIWAAR